MPSPSFKRSVKASFKDAKSHISSLESELSSIKSIISQQNDILKEMSLKLMEFHSSSSSKDSSFFEDSFKKNDLHSLSEQLSNTGLKKLNNQHKRDNNEELSSSIGNGGVKHTLSNKLRGKKIMSEKRDNNEELSSSIGNGGVKHKFQPLIENQSRAVYPTPSLILKEKRLFDEDFKIFKHKINETFNKLTKQELRVFMTIYQFSEEERAVSYFDLADKLSLSENCIRSYVSSLVRKGLPIIKRKVNNKLTFLAIEKDFKNLNLRHKLINLYYGVDPFQTSLFDLKG